MPRITKAQMKESIILFADDVIKIIIEKLNLDDTNNREDVIIEHNGWYYNISKIVSFIQPEIFITRQNYKPGHKQYYKDQPKGNHIHEKAWIYKEGMNNRSKYSKNINISKYRINFYRLK